MTAASNKGPWQITGLNNSSTSKYRLWLNCSTRYDVIVMAWNQRGNNDFNDKSVFSVLTDTGTAFFCEDVIQTKYDLYSSNVIQNNPRTYKGGGGGRGCHPPPHKVFPK